MTSCSVVPDCLFRNIDFLDLTHLAPRQFRVPYKSSIAFTTCILRILDTVEARSTPIPR
jgi:hypothetical protein